MKLSPHPALAPLALLYGCGIALRNRWYDRNPSQISASTLPIICVGNVIAGGSGKTPFVQAVASELQQLSRAPAILLRGYGGSIEGPHVVTEKDTAKEVGDEALLHLSALRDVPVVVSRDRYRGAKLIASQNLAETIVMDDGFQHRALARLVNLLLLDISDDVSIGRWGSGRLLPAGWLREPLASALKRASAVVFIDKGDPRSASSRSEQALKALPGSHKLIRFALRPHLLRDIVTGAIYPIDKFVASDIVAVTAIAHPSSYFSLLESIGYKKVVQLPFPDHYQFSNQDAERFLGSGNPVMVTEKDETKLRSLVRVPGRVFSLVLRGSFLDDASRTELLRLIS